MADDYEISVATWFSEPAPKALIPLKTPQPRPPRNAGFGGPAVFAPYEAKQRGPEEEKAIP